MTDEFRKSREDELLYAFDPYAHAITTIGENHRLIHDGFFYAANHYVQGVVTATNVDVLISVPAGTFPHLQELRVSTTNGPDLLSMYEGVTTSADGTSITPFNKNRNSTNTPNTTVFHTPTITDLGTKLSDHLIATPGKDSGIFTQDMGGEWVLKPSTKYLLRFANNSGGNEDVELHFYFYELDYSI